jgi:acyl carrier protein
MDFSGFETRLHRIIRDSLDSALKRRFTDGDNLYHDLGMDSLAAMRFALGFEREFGRPLPPSILEMAWHEPLGQLARELFDQLQGAKAAV